MDMADIETQWLGLCAEYAALYPDAQWKPGLYIKDGDVSNPPERERLCGIIDGFGWVIHGSQHEGEIMSRAMINILRERFANDGYT